MTRLCPDLSISITHPIGEGLVTWMGVKRPREDLGVTSTASSLHLNAG